MYVSVRQSNSVGTYLHVHLQDLSMHMHASVNLSQVQKCVHIHEPVERQRAEIISEH